MKIAIDGPAGAGKSTISKRAAAELGFIYIDTGAMYRAVALFMLRQGIDTKNDEKGIEALLSRVDIDICHVDGEQRVFLCGEDVSDKIRTPEVSVGASNVAVFPAVRTKLTELQRGLANKYNVIMDGRDIGTCVLPDAEVKIFLTASVDARAQRRLLELTEKGIESNFEDVKRDMEYRDKNDSERKCAPLRAAEDSTTVDTTNYNLEESIELVLQQIRKRM